MPTWEEAAGLEPPILFNPSVAAEGAAAVSEALQQMRDHMAAVGQRRADLGAVVDGPNGDQRYPLDGPEPPPRVKALQRPNHEDSFLVRCLKSGWWWSHEPVAPPGRPEGWPWEAARVSGESGEAWLDVTPADTPSPSSPSDDEIVWTFDGDPPPPHIVRLHNRNARATDEQPYVARAADGGYWWVGIGDENPVTGWRWQPQRHNTEQLVAHYPKVRHDETDLVISMARALPLDGRWYRIATRERNGCPIWGRMPDDIVRDLEEYETTTSWSHPDEE